MPVVLLARTQRPVAVYLRARSLRHLQLPGFYTCHHRRTIFPSIPINYSAIIGVHLLIFTHPKYTCHRHTHTFTGCTCALPHTCCSSSCLPHYSCIVTLLLLHYYHHTTFLILTTTHRMGLTCCLPAGPFWESCHLMPPPPFTAHRKVGTWREERTPPPLLPTAGGLEHWRRDAFLHSSLPPPPQYTTTHHHTLPHFFGF